MTRSLGLQALLDEGAATGVFPCATAVVLHRGRRVFDGAAGGATLDTVFDLASLTKVVATTSVCLALWRDRLVGPETPVARLLPDSAAGRAGVTVEDLLAHRSGLPAFRSFFVDVLREMPALRDAGCPLAARAAGRARVVAHALTVEPEAARGIRAVYSDVGFILLGALLERAAGGDLDALFLERVARPLGLAARFRRLSTLPDSGSAPASGSPIAPTGRTRPRDPPPDMNRQQGRLWAELPPRPSPAGEVDDDNAWTMDGVAGHAGLFGMAGDVATFGQAVLDESRGAGRIAPLESWSAALRRDPSTPGSTRALGFDTRVPGDPAVRMSAGALVGMVSPGAAGHTGFTGTSLWIDRGRDAVIALCTNRTAGPDGRANVGINDFRPRFHDAAVAAVEDAR